LPAAPTTTTQREQGRDQREGARDAASRARIRTGRPPRPPRARPAKRRRASSQHLNRKAGADFADPDQRTSGTAGAQPQHRDPDRRTSAAEGAVPSTAAEIVSIEPEYRDYEYFSTDDDIVIVEPREQADRQPDPRDASRIRAAGDQTVTVQHERHRPVTPARWPPTGGASPCRIMRRDSAGNVTELTPHDRRFDGAAGKPISVTVRVPAERRLRRFRCPQLTGQIVVSGQGGADCMVTIEHRPDKKIRTTRHMRTDHR
jgi:hypothetical protein